MAKAKKPVRAKRYKEYDSETLREERQYGFFWYDWIWRAVRPLMIGALSLVIISGMLLSGWNFINSKYLLPVDADDSTQMVFEIASGSSLTAISRKLEEQGLIRSKTVFKYMVDFQGMSGRIKAGAYNLSRDMTIGDIINELTSGSAPTERTIRLIEGWTCEDIAEYLVEQGALKTTDEFLRLCGSPEAFSSYFVVNEMAELVPESQIGRRKYALEGYLAPDTYNIFLNESAESIIRRLLNQSEKVISNIYELREQKKANMLDPEDENATTDDVDLPGMELNQDQLYILASIIEKEAKPEDFARVSAVFHNRLEENMRLESCATVQYVLGTTRLALTNSDTSVDSLFNTYRNEGLPVGPICNPSKAALYAAAFPDEEYLKDGYLFFCSKDPTSGELQFSKTYEEHAAAVEQYRPLWIEYDKSHAGSGGASQESKNDAGTVVPGGRKRQLQAALRFGANAIYTGVQGYGLRAFAGNFTFEEMAEAISLCHAAGVKAYVTLNIFPFDDDLPGMLDTALRLRDMGVDAAIVSDMGALDMLAHEAPGLELHLSTQANAMNARTAQVAHNLGAKRVILAREMSLERIRKLRSQLSPECELETFVHGAVCMSYSGRCVLSDYLTGRGANRGACTQPCRWQYAVVEQKRPGEYFPVDADERGTYIFSSGDLRMLEHIPDLVNAGIDSLKIEGRMKNEYYVAMVTRCYRRALDLYAADPTSYAADAPAVRELGHALDRVSHRRSDTGFFYGAPQPSGGADGFYQSAEFAAYVLEYDARDASALVEVRNRMLLGDELGALTPDSEFAFRLERLENPENGERMDAARVGKSIVRINMPQPVAEGDILFGTVRNHIRQ